MEGNRPNAGFPPPWSVEEQAACFVVIDSAGQKVAYVWAKLLSKDEARRALGLDRWAALASGLNTSRDPMPQRRFPPPYQTWSIWPPHRRIFALEIMYLNPCPVSVRGSAQ